MATGPQGNQGQPRFGPSDRLITMFRACSRDPSDSIKTRLRSMLNTFLQHHRDNAGNYDLAAKCCCETGIWYYRILEQLVSQERTRLGISDISVILQNELFQSCLVACCLEISVFSKLPCDFPQLLKILTLAPYHFLKVIELVLRAEVGLSRSVVRHLAQVEVKVVESLAWSSISPLWEEIRANEGHLPTCQQVMPPSQLEDQGRTDLQPDRNLSGADLGLGAEHPDQQQSSSALNRPQRSNSLHLFARKLYSLMGKRLRALCSLLNICDELRLKIWTCFEYSLVHCTELMRDRLLDQLLLCAIYITAKIRNVEIPFKEIMKCYKSQPFASNSVCKNVLMSRGDRENDLSENNNPGVNIPTPNTPSMHYPGPGQERRANLIHFYNQIFSTKMEHFAKQFDPACGRDTPPCSPFPQHQRSSPRRQRLTSSHSIYISPQDTDRTAPPTPGLCYFFNSSPPERLREINNMVRSRPARRSYAMALYRDGQEEEDGPSARRLRLDDQSAWQQRLRSVANNRVMRRDQDQPSPSPRPNLH